MAVQSGTTSAAAHASQSSEISRVDVEGISAGILGAAVIAIWFFVLDVFNGRPLYTPSTLGSALFRGSVGIDQLQTLPIWVEMVLIYTWVMVWLFASLGSGL